MPVPERHFVNGHFPERPVRREPASGPLVALGCFWGAERNFLGNAGRLFDGGRLRRRRHAQSGLSRGLLRV